MPIHHAVLSLLHERPSHGYELKATFERSIGPQWGSLNIGHLYQILGRLAADGLVISEHQAQHDKPDRTVYAITPDGAAEYGRWLAEPSPRQGGYRDDFFLKVMAAARHTDPSVRQRVIDQQRRYLLGELRNLAELGNRDYGDPVVTLLLSAATLHVRADLDFLDQAEEQLRAPVSASVSSAKQASEERTSRTRRAG